MNEFRLSSGCLPKLSSIFISGSKQEVDWKKILNQKNLMLSSYVGLVDRLEFVVTICLLTIFCTRFDSLFSVCERVPELFGIADRLIILVSRRD